jgi:hypothetical protein
MSEENMNVGDKKVVLQDQLMDKMAMITVTALGENSRYFVYCKKKLVDPESIELLFSARLSKY